MKEIFITVRVAVGRQITRSGEDRFAHGPRTSGTGGGGLDRLPLPEGLGEAELETRCLTTSQSMSHWSHATVCIHYHIAFDGNFLRCAVPLARRSSLPTATSPMREAIHHWKKTKNE